MKTKRSVDEAAAEVKETLFDVLGRPLKRILKFKTLTLFIISFVAFNLDYSKISFINFEKPPYPACISPWWESAFGWLIPLSLALLHPLFRIIVGWINLGINWIGQKKRLEKYINATKAVVEIKKLTSELAESQESITKLNKIADDLKENKETLEADLMILEDFVNDIQSKKDDSDNKYGLVIADKEKLTEDIATIKKASSHIEKDRQLIIKEKEQLAQVVDDLKDERQKMREKEMVFCILRYVKEGKINNIETKNEYLDRMADNWMVELSELQGAFKFQLKQNLITDTKTRTVIDKLISDKLSYTISEKGVNYLDQCFVMGF